MFGVVHAEVTTMAVQRQHGADAIFGIDVDLPRFREREVEDLLVPLQPLLNVHEAEHERLVPPERPAVLVEPLDQLLLALPVHNEAPSTPSGRLEPYHAV